jgi:hypothetical protein
VRFLKLRQWGRWIVVVSLLLFSKDSSANFLNYCKVLLGLVNVTPQASSLAPKAIRVDLPDFPKKLDALVREIPREVKNSPFCNPVANCFYRGMFLSPEEIVRIKIEGLRRSRTVNKNEIWVSNSPEIAASHSLPGSAAGDLKKKRILPVIVTIDPKYKAPKSVPGVDGVMRYTDDLPPEAISHVYYYNMYATPHRFEEWIPDHIHNLN